MLELAATRRVAAIRALVVQIQGLRGGELSGSLVVYKDESIHRPETPRDALMSMGDGLRPAGGSGSAARSWTILGGIGGVENPSKSSGGMEGRLSLAGGGRGLDETPEKAMRERREEANERECGRAGDREQTESGLRCACWQVVGWGQEGAAGECAGQGRWQGACSASACDVYSGAR